MGLLGVGVTLVLTKPGNVHLYWEVLKFFMQRRNISAMGEFLKDYNTQERNLELYIFFNCIIPSTFVFL